MANPEIYRLLSNTWRMVAQIGMAFKADASGATVKVRLYGHVYANTLD